jgi:hypothetical protein
MAQMGHRKDALDWIRQYWGGMLEEGATSFWEGYDPSWYKEDFHSSLQADNRSGYFVSLAHGWSSGPTAWLMEEVLGIQPTGAGFSTVDIRPDLVDMEWAKGAEPTPHGLLKVDAKKTSSGMEVAVDVPEGVVAHVSLPATAGTARVTVNSKTQECNAGRERHANGRDFDLCGAPCVDDLAWPIYPCFPCRRSTVKLHLSLKGESLLAEVHSYACSELEAVLRTSCSIWKLCAEPLCLNHAHGDTVRHRRPLFQRSWPTMRGWEAEGRHY